MREMIGVEIIVVMETGKTITIQIKGGVVECCRKLEAVYNFIKEKYTGIKAPRRQAV